MPPLKILTLYEHDKVTYRDLLKELEIPEDKLDELKEKLYKLNEFFTRNPPKSTSNDSPEETESGKNKGFLILYSDAVEARHYVGFATVDNLLIQVLPKVFKPKGSKNNRKDEKDALLAFIRMLNVSYGMKIRDVELANLRYSKIPNNILEIFIYLFAKSLWEEVQKGYYRGYQEIQREEKFLRGKLLVSRQIKKLPHKRHTFSVELHEFSEDNLLNQIFYATIRFSLSRTNWSVNRRLLSQLMMVFDGVSVRKITEAHLRRMHFTRLNDRFRKPFNLAKIILKSFGGISGEEVGGFFVDMNELFERFILWILKRSLSEYEITYQKPEMPFLRSDTLKDLTQRPDFVVYEDNSPIAVIDAKYREIKENSLSADMARQMYVYAKLLENEKNTKGIETILIFPKSEHYNSNLGTKEATFFDGTNLTVLTYNMDILSPRIDKEFENILRDILKTKRLP